MYKLCLIGTLWRVKNATFVKIELNNLIAITNVSKCVQKVVIGEVRVHIVAGRVWEEPRNMRTA